jgi:small subunit ribosomal protein S21
VIYTAPSYGPRVTTLDRGALAECAHDGYSRAHTLPMETTLVQVIVRDNNVDQALKALKKKMQREGIFREMKLRKAYEKPSERKAREKSEAIRRARKLERKRIEREGF